MSRPTEEQGRASSQESSHLSPGFEERTGTPADEYEMIESWLDEHPAFLQSFFVRKASRSVVDAWLQARTCHTSGASGSVSAPVSGATTPVRKISATEFERCSLLLRPMVSTTSDGTPTFLPVTPAESLSDVGKAPPRKSRRELESLDEKHLIFELVKDICNDLDVKSLCHKILQNICTLLRADRCSLFLVRGGKDDPDRHFVSNLFDVSADSTIEQMETREEIKVPWGTGIVGFVGASGSSVHISDCYADDRFSDLVDRKTGYRTKNMLCAPIHDIYGDVMGVAQVINKLAKNSCDEACAEADFDQKDMEEFTRYLQFCGIGLRNAQLFERSQVENKRNQVLLDLARMVFEEQSTLEHIAFRIMVHVQSLLEVERCQILLISEDSEYIDSRKTFCRVFDLEASDVKSQSFESDSCPHEGRFPINIGITGECLPLLLLRRLSPHQRRLRCDDWSHSQHRGCIPGSAVRSSCRRGQSVRLQAPIDTLYANQERERTHHWRLAAREQDKRIAFHAKRRELVRGLSLEAATASLRLMRALVHRDSPSSVEWGSKTCRCTKRSSRVWRSRR